MTLEDRLWQGIRTYKEHLFVVVVFLGFNLWIRWSLMDFVSMDFIVFLAPWINYLDEHGLASYKVAFTNYSPLYTYYLGLGNYLFPFAPSLYMIKGITFIGEAFAAFWIHKIVGMHYANRPTSLMPVIAPMLFLMCPSVVANGVGAAQCDTWYTAFLLAAVYYLLRNRPAIGMIYAGLSFSFKLQAIFLAPLLLVFILRKKIPWYYLLIVVVVYAITCIPCYFEGRSWQELATIYWHKFSRERINSDAANFYLYFGRWDPKYVTRMGLLLTVEIAALLAYISKRNWKTEPTALDTVLLASMFGALMPFLLPTMHDRYFFVADVFSLILACMRPRWFIIPILLQSATLMATPERQFLHLPGIIGWIQHFSIRTGAWLNAVAVTTLLYLCWQHIWRKGLAPLPAPAIPHYVPYESRLLAATGLPILSVVVPCYNEADNLPAFYERLSSTLANFPSENVQILFINDGSEDNTWHIIRQLSARNPSVTGLRLSRNFGHQMALTCGLEHAKGQRVLVIDADLQDPPELLPEMMRKMDEGFDIVYGKRQARKGETLFKRFSAWCFYRVLNQMSDVTIPLDTGDFRLMTHDVVQAIGDLPERVRYTRGLGSWLGFSHAPVEYIRHPRHAGESHYTLASMLRLANDGITSFSTRPLELATWIGAAMMGLSTLLLGYVFISWLFFDTVAGWTSLAAIFLLSQAFQWLVLGIIGNYVAVIFRETKARPHYIVRETLNG